MSLQCRFPSYSVTVYPQGAHRLAIFCNEYFACLTLLQIQTNTLAKGTVYHEG